MIENWPHPSDFAGCLPEESCSSAVEDEDCLGTDPGVPGVGQGSCPGD